MAAAARGIEATLPVPWHEFAASLWRSLETVKHRTTKQASLGKKLGIAVSGGVDSMALAVLCKQMQEQDAARPQFTAFVVDHAARPGSDEESLRVVAKLQELGLTTQRLKLDWQDEGRQPPLELPNFETMARKLRFRALGRACAQSKIDSLILGHHSNDLIETHLYRLSGGGLPFVAHTSGHIPECQGIPFVDNDLDRPVSRAVNYGLGNRNMFGVVDIAGPGIQVHKPLQAFSKARLVATCRSNNVDWVEDATNQDPTLTPRNAIRHMLEHHTLPRCFKKTSLLRLIHHKTKAAAVTSKTAEGLFERMQGNFNPCVGSLRLTFPRPKSSMSQATGAAKYLSNEDTVRVCQNQTAVAIELLSHCMRVIQPNAVHSSDKKLAVLERFVGAMVAGQGKSWHERFNIAGIQWSFDSTPQHCMWRLRREVPLRRRRPQSCEFLPGQAGEWQLFDGRFWVRIDQISSGPENIPQPQGGDSRVDDKCADILRSAQAGGLEVRFLSPNDMPFLHEKMDTTFMGASDAFSQTLKMFLPHESRWTLPVISPRGVKDVVLALPTMRWHLPGMSHLFRWSIQYAHVHVPKAFVEGRGNR